MDELIKRLEAASGPDRELDARIACVVLKPDWLRNDTRKLVAW